MIDQLCDLSARAVFFPVRHHSPACARHVRALARAMKPAAILIEGPSDFNERVAELHLPHTLPIAIYSYVRLPDGARRGGYHPFCEYSPEWVALRTARELKAVTRFIDLPYADIAAIDATANRYADRGLAQSKFVARLCQRAGVETFDELWDSHFEADRDLPLEEFLRRLHQFCLHSRQMDDEVSESDRLREAFMADQVRAALKEFKGRILVVTGGYHSSALFARLNGIDFHGTRDAPREASAPDDGERGIALTPYSYERLDSLRGYNAGMPNPGFYHQAWLDAERGRTDTHRELLARVAKALRKAGQPISSADLIAAEGTAQGLAQMRGRTVVWRADLVDGITGALIKEERAYNMRHPLLDAVHEVFRGGERGELAKGTALPPLVEDLKKQLKEYELVPKQVPRNVDLDLETEADRERSRLLHRVRVLSIAGFNRTDGTDFAQRGNLVKLWERWNVKWSPDHDATAVEAARYGAALLDATAARLTERAASVDRNAEEAAKLVLDAAFAGLSNLAGEFASRLAAIVRADADFFSVTKALGHLLYLFVHDHVLSTSGRNDIGELFTEAYARGLWLLETLGQPSGKDREATNGVAALLDAFERAGDALNLDRAELVGVFERVSASERSAPILRGAALGALWTLGESDAHRARAALLLFADPARLGDFLTGLFALAREAVQRNPDLVIAVDQVVAAFGDDEFLEALPALRLAFTYFTPREKHHLGLTLLRALGIQEAASLTTLEVTADEMAEALAFEGRVWDAAKKYGVRLGDDS